MTQAELLHAKWLEGIKFFEAKDYKQAHETFTEILAQDPDHAPSLAGMANICLDNNHKRKAWEYISKAVQILPRHLFTLAFATRVALTLGMFDEAKRYADKAYKIDPKSKEAIAAKLMYLKTISDTVFVPKLAKQLLALDKSPNSRLLAGTALESAGNITEAIRIYRAALRDILATNPPPPTRRNLVS